MTAPWLRRVILFATGGIKNQLSLRSSSPSAGWFDNTSSYTAPSAGNWQLYEAKVMVLRIGADSTTMDSGTVDLFSSRPRQVCQMARYVKVLGNTGENLAALPETEQSTED